jgi:hypothetical protein
MPSDAASCITASATSSSAMMPSSTYESHSLTLPTPSAATSRMSPLRWANGSQITA